MKSFGGAKQSLPRAKRGGGNLFLRNGLLRYAHNDEPQRFLRRTLSVLLAMTIVLTPCQAAIEFDGIDDYITITKPSALVNQISVCLWAQWITIGTTISTIQVLVDNNHSNGPNRGFIIQDRPDLSGHLTFSTNPSTPGVQSTIIVGDGTLHHICGCNDGTNSILYIDGNLNASTPEIPNNNYQPNVSFGHWLGGSRYLNGKLDNVRIYNRALSAVEVEALYKSGKKRVSGSLANGLVAHYEMDDDAIGEITAQAKDSSGNLNHGQFIGFDNLTTALSNDVPAQIETGHSLEFDGVNSYIEVAGPSSGPINNIGTGDFTLSLWATNKATTNYQEMIGNWGSNGLFLGRDSTAGQLHAYVGDANAHVADINYTIPSDNSWHFYTLKRTSGNCEVYVDGIIQGTNFNAPGTLATTVATRIGSRGDSVTEVWNGNIDDARIYNRALTASEISFLYNGSGLDPGTSNLQALWTFDEDSALKDSSGNNNHGFGVGGDSLKYTEGVLRR
jgi:hypothetical protein